MYRVGLVLVMAVLTLVAGCHNSEAKEGLPPATGSGAPPPPKIPTVASAKPAEMRFETSSLVVTGTARPLHEAKVGPKGSGVITALPVEEGDRVKKGQLLFRLDAANQALAVSQAEAALSGALVQEQAAKVEFERIKKLHETGSIAPAVFDQVKAQYEGAKASVALARAAVASARQATADTAVPAPIAGVIASRHASLGDTVTMMPPTVVLVIQDISKLEVRGNVPETMLTRIQPGSPIKVRFLAIGEERTVQIERINPSVDPITRTIEVVALVPNEDEKLRAGMLVELDFRMPVNGAPAAPPSSAHAKGAVAP